MPMACLLTSLWVGLLAFSCGRGCYYQRRGSGQAKAALPVVWGYIRESCQVWCCPNPVVPRQAPELKSVTAIQIPFSYETEGAICILGI